MAAKYLAEEVDGKRGVPEPFAIRAEPLWDLRLLPAGLAVDYTDPVFSSPLHVWVAMI